MKKNKLPPLVKIAIFTFLTIILWVAFEIYRGVTKKPDIDVPPQVLLPLEPELDQETLEKINKRFYLEEEEIPEISPSATATPPAEESLPTASPSPSPGTDGEATPEGTLE